MKRDALRATTHSRQITEKLNRLSAKRQEIIRPIFEHPRSFVLSSVRLMAKRLGTDPATVVRIVRGLGFPGFREFQHFLHDLSLAFATSADTMRKTPHATGVPGHVADSLQLDSKNLQALTNTLDAKRVAAFAKRIHEARRIVVIAGDLAISLANYFEYHLILLDLNAFAATSSGRIFHHTRSLTKRDLVVAISFRRGLRQTVEGTQDARERGAHCVGITDTYLSPLTRVCHETFLAGIESNSFGASYTAPIALLNAILTAVGQHRQSHTIAIVKEISEEQRRGSRWYHD
ncbi:MAG TPA: MurR/RpiR family transcriptional regulator [Candidatus Dormibacteraeota bacterium]|jgi:RpiR family carbohydrate utilization transcriptional regulator|nr:MurR/RpiR family transcriptional regulator [Candidatus Dormibacteraeota bacterium]